MPRKDKESYRQYNREYYAIPKNKAKQKVSSHKWYLKTKPIRQEKAREYWAKPENKLKNRRSVLMRDYGITLDQYNILFDSQNGLCAICNRAENHKTHKTLHVDHNHETGKVRALLCHKCNSAIGMLDESVERLQKVIEYLNKYANN